jgi:hypothetical protein
MHFEHVIDLVCCNHKKDELFYKLLTICSSNQAIEIASKITLHEKAGLFDHF